MVQVDCSDVAVTSLENTLGHPILPSEVFKLQIIRLTLFGVAASLLILILPDKR